MSVIIVNWNGRQFIGELLDSLSRQSVHIDETIVVDNASSDGSTEFLERHFPRLTLVPLSKNVGFAQGNNVAFKYSRGEYVAFLNSDTVLSSDCLFELVRLLDSDPHTGAVVPKIYQMDRGGDTALIECAGAEFNNLGFCWGRGAGQRDGPRFGTARQVPALTACATVVRRNALNGEPPFDAKLFMYYEELDLSLRLRGRGYKIMYAPSAVVWHRRGGSVKQATQTPVLFTQFYGNRNRVKILSKYYPLRLLIRNLPLILMSLAYWDIFILRRGGAGLFIRALSDQIRFACQGAAERRRGTGVRSERWLPRMTRHGLADVLALRPATRTYSG
ncbi:MAG: glycosyltransferase family 2 protein [Chloroflexi bacterium]|nr:glycosyltransferase family 2 protein [Chloroflexota bacterium]